MPDSCDHMVDLQLGIAAAYSDRRAAAAAALAAVKPFRPTRVRCECCGFEIGYERLEALPFARTCILCQTKIERGTLRGRH